jgi:Tol biopolymer transport system component/DNA-binding winged helix-turn-helix (wHTH) protein
MATSAQNRRSLRFDGFEVDPRSREVRKNGSRVRLQDQPLEVLLLLVERRGEVVSREELKERLWPAGTFVDSDDGLNTAIKKLRDVLSDSSERPRYIETIPRRGYRFVGTLEVEEAEAPERRISSVEGLLPNREASPSGDIEAPISGTVAEAIVPVNSNRGSKFRLAPLYIAATILAVSALALGAVVVNGWFQHQVARGQATLNARPFTTLPGEENSPAFSPDGSRIAFAWNGDPVSGGKGFDLYVKAIGSETLLRLTQHPSEMIGAAWSPDGTQIAFHRMAGTDSGIYVVPALGGLERKLHSTFIPFPTVVRISWSPDGKWIAFTNISPGKAKPTISLLSTETGEIKRLPGTPKCLMPAGPAFSHSGEYLAYTCFQTQEEFGLYTIPPAGGPPRLILVDSRDPGGLTWSADGKSLITTWSNELDEVTVANGSVKRLDLSAKAGWPNISSDGRKLAFTSPSGIADIWRRDLLHPESPPLKLAPSTRGQEDAQFSPDGKHIAFMSERTGISGVWVSNVDGSDLVEISNSQVESGNPQWSPDGKKIAFDAHPVDGGEISVADLSERIPRKLVTNISHLSWPTWSHNGKWLYFMSNEVGRTGIYRCSASGGDAVALTKEPYGAVAQESFDGEAVYFTNQTAYPVIKKVSLSALPGTAFEVDGLRRLRYGAGWTLTPGGIYFVPGEAPRSVRYFDFATRRVRTLFQGDKDFCSGLSVSADGRWLLYAQVNEVNSDIMLVDHFH